MTLEVFKVVRQAESDGDKLIEEARDKAAEIIDEAEEEAKKIKDSKLAGAKKAAETYRNEQMKQAADELKGHESKSNQKISDIRSKAEQNMKKAVDIVVDKVVSRYVHS